jgi:hypothetical protein
MTFCFCRKIFKKLPLIYKKINFTHIPSEFVDVFCRLEAEADDMQPPPPPPLPPPPLLHPVILFGVEPADDDEPDEIDDVDDDDDEDDDTEDVDEGVV